MKPEQQRIAIAEACGWKRYFPTPESISRSCPKFSYWVEPRTSPNFSANFRSGYLSNPPNYLNDLNAMHEAEKVLDEKHKRSYAFILAQVLDTSPTVDLDDQFLNIHATAAQRAEAFLRTLLLWTEE